mmetsp:Transcript_20689/g.33085  ORF Transcript_20689/g.33085 Transcript_20689/m.33085 type:complete len:247 (-) Transcript_20689:8-748(-)
MKDHCAFWMGACSAVCVMAAYKVLSARRSAPTEQEDSKRWTSARVANAGARRERKKLQRDAKAGYQTPIIACENCNDYRDLIPRCVEVGDVVLEVGCHVGGTTGLIGAIACKTLGIDASAAWLPQARHAYPHLQFEQCDCFNISKIKSYGYNFTKIFIDTSGSRELKTLLPLIEGYIKALAPQLIVVKSFKLKRLLLQSTLAEDFACELPADYAAKTRAVQQVASTQKQRRKPPLAFLKSPTYQKS